MIQTLDQDKAKLAEMKRRGEMIAEVLRIPVNPENGRYWTQWGDKTAIGLYEVTKRLVEDGQ